MTKQNRKSFNIAITAQKAAIKRNEKALEKLINDRDAYLKLDIKDESVMNRVREIAQLEFEIESSKRPNLQKKKRLKALEDEHNALFQFDIIHSLNRETALTELITKQRNELRFLESLPLDLEKHRFRGWLA
ncbi:hypothetical protein [Vibrio harveyi]|uniref:hypothetical protein n=1 Tax=Vibrio harveyi TaxID=669 RepID=UPI0003492511|nr:hypothetical protein [Vibrio harveyi]GEA22297.1 hypothetical protein VH1807_contig00024-0015 [Vibrio harveyi]HDM8166650.1 hypothetical protein [Vibrio harveyi]